MLVKTINNLDLSAPFSYLSNVVGAGASTVPVRNINAFTSSWAVQIGKTGEESSEVKLISSISGTALVLTGTATYDHQADTPIYATKFDQVIFKRSTAGTSGTATALTNGTVTITPDGTVTVFDDTSAASSYAYKTQFYNSVTLETSSESDWITPSGFSFYSLAKMRQRIKDKLFGKNILSGDGEVNDWINEWMEKLNNIYVDVNKDYAIGTADVTFGTTGLGTITASDYKDMRRVWVTYDGTGFAQSTKMDYTGFYPTEVFNTTRPFHYFQGDTILGIKPESTGGTARISYYKLNPVLVNDTDELPTPMKGYTKSFVDYALSQAYYLDSKEDKGAVYLKSAEVEADRFRQEISSRNKSGPQTIQVVDALDAEDGTLEIQ